MNRATQTLSCTPVSRDKAALFNFKVAGQLDELIDENRIMYIAASPPDHRTSFSGSGLPFPNMQMAFENTPNYGHVMVDQNKKFEIDIAYPNSFYAALGTIKVGPRVYLMYKSNGVPKQAFIELGAGIPYRSLTYPVARTQAMFYDNLYNLPVRTQEQILYDSSYPSIDKEHDNFWGLRPAV